MKILRSEDIVFILASAKELFFARICLAWMDTPALIRACQHPPDPKASRRASQADIARFSWALNAVANRVPWRADCLPRCFAAARWLRRQGCSPEFFLGANLDAAGQLRAHAWLRCDGIAICGGDGREFAALIEPEVPAAQA